MIDVASTANQSRRAVSGYSLSGLRTLLNLKIHSNRRSNSNSNSNSVADRLLIVHDNMNGLSLNNLAPSPFNSPVSKILSQ